MDEFIVIKVMNESMLRLKKSKSENYDFNETIKEDLKDEAFFFKTDKTNAINILKGVGVADDKIEETYEKLTNKNIYDKLIEKGIITSSDNLNVKYN